MTSASLSSTLDHLFTAAASLPTGVAARGHVENVQLKVVTRQDRRLICVWQDNGHRVRPAQAEEIGEDAGFYDPVLKDWTCAESQRATLISEGYAGGLCEHEFTDRMHADAKLSSMWMFTCAKCRIQTSIEQARRGKRRVYLYDVWELRGHIFQRWSQRGPVPGGLKVQAHHEQGSS